MVTLTIYKFAADSQAGGDYTAGSNSLVMTGRRGLQPGEVVLKLD
jgi:hypothetical protein